MSESIEKQKIEIAVQEKELETKEFFDRFSKGARWTFIVLAVGIIPIFFIVKFAVAKIYLHNFAKTQVAAHEAIIEPLAIQIVETKALTMTGDSYSAYAQIKNPNKNLSASDITYTFRFMDASGKELGHDGGKTYILGGEQKYLVLPNIRLKEVPTQVKVEISNPDWKRRLSVPNILIKAGIPQFKDVNDPAVGFEIKSNIQNLSTKIVGTVKISAIVTDKNGTVIAVNQRTENTLKPQEVRDYTMFWPLPLASQVSGVPRIIVETDVLDPDNLK